MILYAGTVPTYRNPDSESGFVIRIRNPIGRYTCVMYLLSNGTYLPTLIIPDPYSAPVNNFVFGSGIFKCLDPES